MKFKYLKPFLPLEDYLELEWKGYHVDNPSDIHIEEKDILFRGTLYNKVWKYVSLPYICIKKEDKYQLFFRANGLLYEVTKEIYNRYVNIPDIQILC